MTNPAIKVFITALAILLMAGPAPARVLKIATLAPEGAFEVKEIRKAGQEIATKTNGRLKLKIYPGGVMGNDQAVVRKIRFNQLQGGMVAASSLASLNRDGQVYSLPFIFRSFAELDYVRPRMDPFIIKGYERAGFKIFGLAEGGFARVLSKTPVTSVKDLQHRKVWAPANDASAITALQAYGIQPIPLPVADVRAGLQTSLIDTVAIPPAYAIILQWHTQVQYITDLPLLYTYGMLALDNKAFNKLTPGDRQVVSSVITETFKRIDRHNRQLNVDARKALEDNGITFITPKAEDIAIWQEKTTKVTASLLKQGKLSQEALDTITSLLAEFRNKGTR
ncbi:MAG: TRAP transporter substrate-binding protein DctP [Thermodesulfobacteriota bacterium]